MFTQDSLAAALVTQIALRLERLDPAQCLHGIDDGDAGMTAERQQVLAIPGDDWVGLRRDCGGDDLIVIDITGHDPRHGGRRDQFNDLDVIGERHGGCLLDEREARYGRFTGPPTPDTLARHFHLDAADLTLIDELRGEHNRLGFAVMLGSARYLGTFLDQAADIPGRVLHTVSRPSCMSLEKGASTNFGSTRAFVRCSRSSVCGRSIDPRAAACSSSPKVPITASPHSVAACRMGTL